MISINASHHSFAPRYNVLLNFGLSRLPPVHNNPARSLLALFCHEFSIFHWYDFTGWLPHHFIEQLLLLLLFAFLAKLFQLNRLTLRL